MRNARFDLLMLLLLAACSQEPTGPKTGSLTITVTGLSGPADISVIGPGKDTQTVTATTTLENLSPGNYTINAPLVRLNSTRYAADHPSAVVQVTASSASARASVTYALAGYAFDLAISGLPSPAAAEVTITGPGSFTGTVTGATTVLVPVLGTYTIVATSVVSSGHFYAPASDSSTVTVTETEPLLPATVTYAPTNEALTITVSGLPDGTTGEVHVSGPDLVSQVISVTTTFMVGVAGTYKVSSPSLLVSGHTYVSAVLPGAVVMTRAAPASASVTYAVAAVANVKIDLPAGPVVVGTAPIKLSATTWDAAGDSLLGAVTWQSGNTAIASVDSVGAVSPVGAGTVSIVAMAEGISGSASIVVEARTPVQVSGTWKFQLKTNSVRGSPSPYDCSASGTLVIDQAPSDSNFTATGQASGSCYVQSRSGTTREAFPSNISTTGVALNAGIRLVVGPCRLSTTTFTATSLAGTVTCHRGNGYKAPSSSGTWSATKVR